jgi:hypothetical protein
VSDLTRYRATTAWLAFAIGAAFLAASNALAGSSPLVVFFLALAVAFYAFMAGLRWAEGGRERISGDRWADE